MIVNSERVLQHMCCSTLLLFLGKSMAQPFLGTVMFHSQIVKSNPHILRYIFRFFPLYIQSDNHFKPLFVFLT